MIASAGMHARDILRRTHAPSVLSYITPTRCAHRWQRIAIAVSGGGKCW